MNTNAIIATDTIGSIVVRNWHAARVFGSHGLDLSYNGTVPLRKACKEAHVPLGKILSELASADKRAQEMLPDCSRMAIDELTRFIENYHHRFASQTIVFVKSNVERLVRLYGNRHPELVAIEKTFSEMAAHLTVHMKHEEFVLFPYIRKMVKKRRKVGGKIFKSMSHPVATMLRDHENQGARLKTLEVLTHHYTAPDNTCPVFNATYAAMKELEADLEDHLYLENDILFPRAVELENIFTDN